MCKQILIVLSILIAFGCADDPQNQQASCGERLPEEEKLRSASIPDNATTPGENESASDVDETEPSHISYRVTEFKAYDIRHLRWVGEPDNITHIQADNSGWSQNNGRFFVDFEFYHQFDPAFPQSCRYETDTSGKKAWRFNVTLESEPQLPFEYRSSSCSYQDEDSPVSPENTISYSSLYHLNNYQTHIPSDTEVTLYLRVWDKACSEHGCSSIDNGSFVRGTSNTAVYKITFLHGLTDPE